MSAEHVVMNRWHEEMKSYCGTGEKRGELREPGSEFKKTTTLRKTTRHPPTKGSGWVWMGEMMGKFITTKKREIKMYRELTRKTLKLQVRYFSQIYIKSISWQLAASMMDSRLLVQLLNVWIFKQSTLTLMALLTISLPVERPCTKALAAIKARDN